MSSVWKDESGATWNASIEKRDIERLRRAGVDLMDPKSVEKAMASAIDQIEFLSELHRPQWEKRKLNYEAFAKLLIGSLGPAGDAFMHSFEQYLIREGQLDYARRVADAIKAASL